MGITRKDWSQLSAYIDGELSKREEDLLKRRIQSDPQFQSALDQLKITKRVLQSTPPLTVPRNFTLTPNMAGYKPKRLIAAGYRLAAAMMSFLLIGVLVLDFGRLMLGGAMSPAAPRMEEVMLESAAKEVYEPAQIEVEGEVNQDRMAAEPVDGAHAEDIQAEQEAPAVLAEAEVTEETLGFELDAAGEEKRSPDNESDTGANMADEIKQPATTTQSLPSQTPQPQPTIEYFSSEEEVYSLPWYNRIPVFRVIELFLVIGIVSLGAAAWIKRRRY